MCRTSDGIGEEKKPCDTRNGGDRPLPYLDLLSGLRIHLFSRRLRSLPEVTFPACQDPRDFKRRKAIRNIPQDYADDEPDCHGTIQKGAGSRGGGGSVHAQDRRAWQPTLAPAPPT